MKTMNFCKRMMAMGLMMAICITMSAQHGGRGGRSGGNTGRGGHTSGQTINMGGGRGGNTTHGGSSYNHGGSSYNRGGSSHNRGGATANYGGGHRNSRHEMNRPVVHHNVHHHVVHHTVHHRPVHHIPSHWAHCVRYMPDGRWGYCRGGYWYYYDTYYEPDYYFAHPVAHFQSRCTGTVAAIAAAANATVAVANFVDVLMHQ